jgi:hypothetical protein
MAFPGDPSNLIEKLSNQDLRIPWPKRLAGQYLATDTATGRAHYSGAYFGWIGGAGNCEDVANQFTAEDLLAVTMLSFRIEGTTRWRSSTPGPRTQRPSQSAPAAPVAELRRAAETATRNRLISTGTASEGRPAPVA